MSRSRTRFLMLLLVALPCRVQRGFAQIPSAPPARRWEISVSAGYGIAGTRSRFEDVMRRSGLGDTEGCDVFCVGAISNPHSRGALTTGVEVSYAVRARWRVQVERISADLGETFGYHEPLTWVFLHPSVTTVATLAVFSLAGPVRIGAGPALSSVQVTRTDLPGGPGSRARRLGFVLLGSVVSSERGRVFAAGTAQFAFVGSPSVGPFVGQALAGPATAVMPRTPISFNYATIHLGLGLRF